MFAVYCREFKMVTHDVGIILFFMFLPLAYPIIYSLIYNPELVKDVSMVVVDHDRTALSRELVRKMDACDQAHVIGYATDLGDARRAIDSHKAYAILEIPEGFARKVGRNEASNAVMYCEMSLLLRYRGFLVASTNVMQEFSSELMTENIDRIAPLPRQSLRETFFLCTMSLWVISATVSTRSSCRVCLFSYCSSASCLPWEWREERSASRCV